MLDFAVSQWCVLSLCSHQSYISVLSVFTRVYFSITIIIQPSNSITVALSQGIFQAAPASLNGNIYLFSFRNGCVCERSLLWYQACGEQKKLCSANNCPCSQLKPNNYNSILRLVLRNQTINLIINYKPNLKSKIEQFCEAKAEASYVMTGIQFICL